MSLHHPARMHAFGNSLRSCLSCFSLLFPAFSPSLVGRPSYHSQPGTAASPGSCVYNDTAGQHSPIYAVMADGIPLYGALGDNGVVPTNLDVCRGHTDTTHTFYHYHITNSMAAPVSAQSTGLFEEVLHAWV